MGSSGSIVYTPAQIEKRFEILQTKLDNTPQRDAFCRQLEKEVKDKKSDYDRLRKEIEEYQKTAEPIEKQVEALNESLTALGKSIMKDTLQIYEYLEYREKNPLNQKIKEEKPKNGSADDSNYFNLCQ